MAAEIQQPDSQSQLQISLFIRPKFSSAHMLISLGVRFRILVAQGTENREQGTEKDYSQRNSSPQHENPRPISFAQNLEPVALLRECLNIQFAHLSQPRPRLLI